MSVVKGEKIMKKNEREKKEKEKNTHTEQKKKIYKSTTSVETLLSAVQKKEKKFRSRIMVTELVRPVRN